MNIYITYNKNNVVEISCQRSYHLAIQSKYINWHLHTFNQEAYFPSGQKLVVEFYKYKKCVIHEEW